MQQHPGVSALAEGPRRTDGFQSSCPVEEGQALGPLSQRAGPAVMDRGALQPLQQPASQGSLISVPPRCHLWIEEGGGSPPGVGESGLDPQWLRPRAPRSLALTTVTCEAGWGGVKSSGQSPHAPQPPSGPPAPSPVQFLLQARVPTPISPSGALSPSAPASSFWGAGGSGSSAWPGVPCHPPHGWCPPGLLRTPKALGVRSLLQPVL